MKVYEILGIVDELNPNTYDEKIKIDWLSKIEGRIFNECILTHEHELVDDGEGNMVEPTFTGYSEEDEDTDLIVEDTYTDLYRDYLMAMIAYSNGESERYTNSMLMFNTNLQSYYNYYNRTHKPIQKPLHVFG